MHYYTQIKKISVFPAIPRMPLAHAQSIITYKRANDPVQFITTYYNRIIRVQILL